MDIDSIKMRLNTLRKQGLFVKVLPTSADANYLMLECAMYRIDYDEETMTPKYIMPQEDTYTRETCPVKVHSEEYDGYGSIRCPCCNSWLKKWGLIPKYYRGMFMLDKKSRKKQVNWNVPKDHPQTSSYWQGIPQSMGETIATVI